jgi:hypothetical protein
VQADLFKAVLAAVYVDSGFTLRAPAGVYAASMDSAPQGPPPDQPQPQPQPPRTAGGDAGLGVSESSRWNQTAAAAQQGGGQGGPRQGAWGARHLPQQVMERTVPAYQMSPQGTGEADLPVDIMHAAPVEAPPGGQAAEQAPHQGSGPNPTVAAVYQQQKHMGGASITAPVGAL